LGAFIFFGATSILLAFPLTEDPFGETANDNALQREALRSRTVDMERPSTASRSASFAAIPETSGQASDFRDVESDDELGQGATSAHAEEGAWSGHSITAVAPNIENLSQVVGVHPGLVRNWVVAGLRNETGAQEQIFRQMVQIIETRRGNSMNLEHLSDLRSELANRALEAQGRPVLPDDEDGPALKEGELEEDDVWR